MTSLLSSIRDRFRNIVKPLAMIWIRYFRYRKYRMSLAARGDSKPAAEGFEAVAFDPKLRARPTRGTLRPGWYLMTYRAKTGFADSLFVPKIYPLDAVETLPRPRRITGDFGSTPDSMAQVQLQPDARPSAEPRTVNLRAHFPGFVHHLFYYDLGPAGFRLDPFDLEYPRTRIPNLGWFSIEDLTLTYLGKVHLFRYCLTHGIRKSHAPGRELAILFQFLIRGKASAFYRWLYHRTYKAIQPSISLTTWLRFFLSSNAADPSSREIASHASSPQIKMILRTDQPRGERFRRFIDHVISQEYPHWEVFIWPVAGAPAPTILDRWYCRDPRIKFLRADQTPNLTQNSNHFWCAIDASSLLDRSSLRQFAKAILAESPDIVYADDAELSHPNERVVSINLRPAFSLDHFLANTFTGLLTLVRGSTLTCSPNDWADKDAHQIFEAMVLDALASCEKVLHIPDVLHTRTLVAQTKPAKRLDAETATRLLRKMGVSTPNVETNPETGVYRVRYCDALEGKTAIIIPTKNQGELLKTTIRSIQRTVPEHLFDLVVVDHDSDEPQTLDYLDQLRQSAQIILAQGEFNFSRINNLAVRQLHGAYENYLFLNNDVEALQSGWFESMRDKLSRSDIGVVGAVLLYPTQADQSATRHDPINMEAHHIQHAGVVLGIGVAEHFMKHEKFVDAYRPGVAAAGARPALVSRGFSAVTAACLMTKADIFQAAKGFDEDLKVAFGDVDFCLRVSNMGYNIVCDGEAVLIHHESASRGKGEDLDPHLEDSAEFERRYGLDIRLGDPFHHPLLVQNNFRYRPIRSPIRAIDPVYRIVARPGPHPRG